ncbi:MAG: hypothetical protein COB77_00365 [Gammaproteobacteria bacterium]|nr:MAG: hypothetical protein COB77_00365 [Gammaproteobacteria bacterium]
MSVATATSVWPLSLEQLSTRAELIFYGKVINNQVKQDELNGTIATYTTFTIVDLIKGDTGNTHTIKQMGGFLQDKNVGMRIHGVPTFQVGYDYVVFLPEKSSLGFSSPLGLHQGRFSVTTINGELIVSNGQRLNNPPPGKQARSAVQIPLAVRAENPSQARLDNFVNTVRSHNIR